MRVDNLLLFLENHQDAMIFIQNGKNIIEVDCCEIILKINPDDKKDLREYVILKSK